MTLRLADLPRRILRRLKREFRSLLYPAPAIQAPLASTQATTTAVAAPFETSAATDELGRLKRELSTQISFLAHDLFERHQTSNQDLVERLQRLEQLASADHQATVEFGNRLIHVESSLQSRLNEVANALFELQNKVLHIDSSVHSRLNDILNVEFPRVHEQVHEATAIVLQSRSSEERVRRTASAPGPSALEPFESSLERAKHDFPRTFPLWLDRLEATEREMRATKVGNAAHAADVYSKMFRQFVETHATGAILDIGCGPYGKPYYLESFPDDAIAGVEPLLFDPPKGIRVVRGISEYLPWPAQSFDTVISATALDHCISLDHSLEEMTRVLKSEGRIILWLGSNPGAKEFRPEAPDFEPADKYHLFHFDIAWFEPRLQQRFEIVDRLRLDRMQYAHVFYCLAARQE